MEYDAVFDWVIKIIHSYFNQQDSTPDSIKLIDQGVGAIDCLIGLMECKRHGTNSYKLRLKQLQG